MQYSRPTLPTDLPTEYMMSMLMASFLSAALLLLVPGILTESNVEYIYLLYLFVMSSLSPIHYSIVDIVNYNYNRVFH